MSGIALVVLAAGASRRLGRCKALVELEVGDERGAGTTPLARLLAAGASLDAAPPLVVTGADHEAIAAAVSRVVDVLHNPAWAAGRTGGVRVAAGARPGLDVCLAPVDVPLVPARVFDALAAAWHDAGSPARGWLAPRLVSDSVGSEKMDRPRFGHPVIVGRRLLEELAELDPDAPLRILRERAEPLLAVDVDAPEILDDLDDEADLARILKRPG